MPYFFESKEEGVIEIPLERWGWVAIYKDGTALQQFDARTGTFHQVGEVNQDQLKRVMLICHEMQGVSPILIPWEDGMKLVHKYRNITLDAFGEPRRFRIYIIGWKKGNEQMFHYILPDDRIITSTNENLPLTEYL